MKRNLLILFGVSASLLAPLAVFAAAANVTEDFTITLPSDSSSYTIKANSTFSKVTVSGSTFTLDLDPKDQTTITASGKQNLANNVNVQTVCSSNQSSAVFSVATTGSSMTVTVTPSGTCDVSTVAASSGGGGGGGGGGSSAGGSSSSAPAPSSTPVPGTSPTASVSPKPTATPAILALAPTPTPVSSAMPILNVPMVAITRVLATGSKGEDVRVLQMFLAADPKIYPEGIANGNFGPKTLAAVKRFQEKYGIAKKGQAGYGTLGPKTRAKIKELSGAAPTTPPVSTTPASAPASIDALQAQLKALQDMLKQLQKK